MLLTCCWPQIAGRQVNQNFIIFRAGGNVLEMCGWLRVCIQTAGNVGILPSIIRYIQIIIINNRIQYVKIYTDTVFFLKGLILSISMRAIQVIFWLFWQVYLFIDNCVLRQVLLFAPEMARSLAVLLLLNSSLRLELLDSWKAYWAKHKMTKPQTRTCHLGTWLVETVS